VWGYDDTPLAQAQQMAAGVQEFVESIENRRTAQVDVVHQQQKPMDCDARPGPTS
jgi:hypothetical protein